MKYFQYSAFPAEAWRSDTHDLHVRYFSIIIINTTLLLICSNHVGQVPGKQRLREGGVNLSPCTRCGRGSSGHQVKPCSSSTIVPSIVTTPTQMICSTFPSSLFEDVRFYRYYSVTVMWSEGTNSDSTQQCYSTQSKHFSGKYDLAGSEFKIWPKL